MFYHTLSPFLVRIYGNFGIRWYSLVYVVGFIALYYLLRYLARKKHIKNLKVEQVDGLIVWIILGIVIGARLFHCFGFEASYYLSNPIACLQIWKGGLAFHGAIIGLAAALLIYSGKYNVKFYELADAICLFAPIMLFFGRIANFINGELYGTITNAGWCVDYSKNTHLPFVPDGCRHPSQLYEALKNLFMFGIFFLVYKKDNKRKLFGTGFYLWLFVGLYGILRFFITFYRDEPAILGLGISQSQHNSGIMFVIGAIMLFRLFKK
ncbi:MAG: prolipoprotein diacylglyceryl transferase [Nanoarchaeota archaeon]|nr:prolipoprotein diacylglyceryl transferase [Nanoarchaeota archaeon]